MTGITEAIRGLVDEYFKGVTPAGFQFGTVTRVDPLVIEVNAKLILTETFLVVAQHLTDYEIPCELTTEQIRGFWADCPEGRHEVTVNSPGWQGGVILLKNHLNVGDKVILARLEEGQQYVVMDRVGDKTSSAMKTLALALFNMPEILEDLSVTAEEIKLYLDCLIWYFKKYLNGEIKLAEGLTIGKLRETILSTLRAYIDRSRDDPSLAIRINEVLQDGRVEFPDPDSIAFWLERLNEWIFPFDTREMDYVLNVSNNFGSGRKNTDRKHAAYDLKAAADTEVLAMTDGEVVLVINKYLNNSQAVFVRNLDGTYILYGEITCATDVKEGVHLRQGQVVGKVTFQKDESGQPSSDDNHMLHIEFYSGAYAGNGYDKVTSGFYHVVDRQYERRPDLIDPFGLLYLLNIRKDR